MKPQRIALAGLLAAALLSGCGQAASADPIQALEDSIQVENQALSFTLPQTQDGGWQISIAGRLAMDGQGMSVHYLEGTDWASGQTYTFPLDENYDSLTLWVTLEDGTEGTIDLLPLLPEELLAGEPS